MRRGVRLGVDVGRARVGIARSDPDGLLAVPVETVSREVALAAITAHVRDLHCIEVVVGLPRSLSGGETLSTADARELAHELAEVVGVPIRLVDERLSTVSAQAGLHQAGKSAKSSKPMIDQASAVIILQHCLDTERGLGQAPGQVLGGELDDR